MLALGVVFTFDVSNEGIRDWDVWAVEGSERTLTGPALVLGGHADE